MVKRKGIVWLLIFAMIMGNVLPLETNLVSAKERTDTAEKVSAEADGLDNLANPRIVPDDSMKAGQKVTWDCVWFGSYPQAEVVPASQKYEEVDKELLQEGDLIQDDELYQKLQMLTGWNEQGDVIVDNEKYRRIKKEDTEDTPRNVSYYQWRNETDYHYFKYQSIKWRVLSVDDSKVFLVADKALDSKSYHTNFEDVTWENSTMRSWLNGYDAAANKQNENYSINNFIDTAFSASVQSAIIDTNVENKDNLSSGTEGGNNTVDKVFLLSESEVYTDAANEYGFVSDGKTSDEARREKSSLYAKAQGAWSDIGNDYAGNCWWWLRSPGYHLSYVTGVNSSGEAGKDNAIVYYSTYGVRPALNLDLSLSPSSYSYAGTVCSDGTVNEKAPNENSNLSNPRIVEDSNMEAGQKVTWDCVWFGSYPQAEVVPASEEYTALDKKLIQEGDLIQDDELYQKLQSVAGWDEQGDVKIDGEKYRRIRREDATAYYIETQTNPAAFYHWKNESDYHYFKYQPIKWRVLSVNGSEAFLLADKALDDKRYYTVYEEVTWEGSTIRSWLNGYGAVSNKQEIDYSNSNFICTAFNQSAQSAIMDTNVENKDNLFHGTEGGNDTVDKIFLLSGSEVYTDSAKEYGFNLDSNVYDEARRAKSSLYAKALGTYSGTNSDYLGNCWWWLRSPGRDRGYYAACVDLFGWASRDDIIVDMSWYGVRPALNLDLTSSSKLYSYAGTVCSDGTVNEKTPSEDAPFSNPRIEEDSSMKSRQKVTWDCVWFGNYPQAEVVSGNSRNAASNKELSKEGKLISNDALYQKLQSATEWDEQGDITLDGEKYRKIEKRTYNKSEIHYYKYQPIKWRVLSVDGSTAFLLADKVLDHRPYHEVQEDVTWEDCTIRSWLNGYDASANKQEQDYSQQNFIKAAFDVAGQSVILVTDVENKNNLSFGTEGGKDTKDKVFLLAESEVYTDAAKEYGFSSEANLYDEARKAKSADTLAEENWWIRSPGLESFYASRVEKTGWIFTDGNFNMKETGGVRPALNLNLTESSDPGCYSYAGTVCSDGTQDEIPYAEKKSNIAQCDISLEKTSYVYDGEAKEPKVIVKEGSSILANGKDYIFSYSDNVDAGEAAIHITGMGKYEGKVSKTFTIVPKSISSADVSLEKDSYVYDGNEKKPLVSVKDGSVTLKSGTDYTLDYLDNILIGTAKVTVMGRGNYTGNITKSFSIVAPVVPLKSFTWNRDNWNFYNSNNYFPSGKYINQINNTYLKKLKENLSNTEYKYIFDLKEGMLYEQWGGSCYGMSVTSLLSMLSLLPYSEYKKDAENLNQLDSPVNNNNISSLITYYQVLQMKTNVRQQMIKTLYKSKKENISTILSLLDANPTVLVCFQKKGWGGHAILAYGYEYGDYSWNGVSYDGCIKICDPNSSKQYRKDYNIYFSTTTYDWIIPSYYSSGPITSQAGAEFSYVGADIDEINGGGYLKGIEKKESALEYVARIDINTNEEAEGYSVVKVEKSNGEYVEQDKDSDDIKEGYSYILSGESKGKVGYNLFDANSAYKITQKDKKQMSLSIDYGECYLEGSISAGKSIIFDKDGYVEASGDAGKFDISMTFDGEHPTKWSTVEVSASNSDGISVEKGDEGYIISGDKLKDISVELEHREDSIQTNFSTEYDTACICELDKETVGVKVDTDGNGTYETVIKKTSSGTVVPTYYPNVTVRPGEASTAKPSGAPTEAPVKTPEVTPTETPMVTPEPIITPEPSATPGSSPNQDNPKKPSKSLKQGSVISDTKTQAVYKITGTGKNKTAEYVRSIKKNASKITIPAKVKLKGDNYKITSIAKNAFKKNKKLSVIVMGKNIKKIGSQAFYGCKKLKNVTIGKNVTTIGVKAFSKCTSLTLITIPSKVKKIGAEAFNQCKNLRYIMVKTKKLTLSNVGKNAFSGGYGSPRVKTNKSVWKAYAKILIQRGLSVRGLFIIDPVKLVI